MCVREGGMTDEKKEEAKMLGNFEGRRRESLTQHVHTSTLWDLGRAESTASEVEEEKLKKFLQQQISNQS